MSENVARFGSGKESGSEDKTRAVQGASSFFPNSLRSLQLTIDEIPHPAYMVNYNFELNWFNEAARNGILGGFKSLPVDSDSRNIFHYLLQGSNGKPESYRRELLTLHLSLAKGRMSKGSVLAACRSSEGAGLDLIDSLYEKSEPITGRAITEALVGPFTDTPEKKYWNAYVTAFREGLLFVFVEQGTSTPDLLDYLSKRDIVIRNLLQQRLPVLTSLSVIVADLQQSTKICSELPADEYFELINEIWATMDPIFRKYYGTHGKHVGDGMVYYFFPQPDSDYVFNAIACAQEVKTAMKRISKNWQIRKNWFNELYMNTGLHAGQEWLGTFRAATTVEFAVLGDTINHAARLSDFARFGQIWATKTLIGKLSPQNRNKVEFGVARVGNGGQEHFISSSYSQVNSLVDLNLDKNEKLRDIGNLSITEIRGVATSDSGH